ncbi:MAG: helix-turn-helix transcriptional regulator, partial [Ktedonobacteraceae bacterium]|nr:helix-turn-helix transcriptional regulator [Ktedonobacteraceae bacterium]
MSIDKIIPNTKIRHQRQMRGWSQKKLADKLDTSKELVSRWERGTQRTSPYYQEKLCTIFGMTAEELGFLEEAEETGQREIIEAPFITQNTSLKTSSEQVRDKFEYITPYLAPTNAGTINISPTLISNQNETGHLSYDATQLFSIDEATSASLGKFT